MEENSYLYSYAEFKCPFCSTYNSEDNQCKHFYLKEYDKMWFREKINKEEKC